MSHPGSITGREPTVDLAAVAVVKGHGATALLASAMDPVLTSASDTSLPVGVPSLAALVAGTRLAGADPTGARLDRQAEPSMASASRQAASSGHAMRLARDLRGPASQAQAGRADDVRRSRGPCSRPRGRQPHRSRLIRMPPARRILRYCVAGLVRETRRS